MTLTQLSASYRHEEEVLRCRIRQVRELSAPSRQEAVVKQDRLRVLEAMRRDVRDVAVLCERYYDRGHRRNCRYSI